MALTMSVFGRMDYERRLWLRRGFGVVVPLVLLGLVVVLVVRPEPSTSARAATPVAGSTPAGDAGVVLSVTPQADGSLAVTERVVFDEPTGILRLSPPRIQTAGTAFGLLTPRATDLRVFVDGTAASGAPTNLVQAVSVNLAGPATEVDLTYVLRGVTVRSVPSSAGRARAVLAPLTQGSAATDQVTLESGGPGLRSVTCPQLPVAEQLCVTAGLDPDSIQGGAPRDKALFVLQVDLPEA